MARARSPFHGEAPGMQEFQHAERKAAALEGGGSWRRESGRKAKGSDASACDVHAKQPGPVDTARETLPPQQRARSAQHREVCGGRHPGTVSAHTAAPSPAPAGLPEPTRVLLQRTSAHGGRGWAALGIPSLPWARRSSAEMAELDPAVEKEVHSPPGCKNPQENALASPRGASISPRNARTAPRVHPCSTERPHPLPGCIHVPEKCPHPARSPIPAAPGASPAHPLRIPRSRGGPGQRAAPSSPPMEETPLPQPLQMAARSLTRADRLGAPGQMGLAPAASSPLLFPPLFALFFFPFAQPPLPSKHHPAGGGRQPCRSGTDRVRSSQLPARRELGCTEFFGRPCWKSKGVGGAQRNPGPACPPSLLDH